MVEIGAGIGRMTCAFTREFGSVIACDLDPGFLERCYETVGRFGKVDRLRTVQVADGRTLDLPDDCADMAFSYITLQHCTLDDALDLVRRGGARRPSGRQGRAQLPRPGGLRRRRRAGRRRRARRLPHPRRSAAGCPPAAPHPRGWQVSRLHPDQVIGPLRPQLADVEVWTNARNQHHRLRRHAPQTFDGINKHHWWLIATRRFADRERQHRIGRASQR